MTKAELNKMIRNYTISYKTVALGADYIVFSRLAVCSPVA